MLNIFRKCERGICQKSTCLLSNWLDYGHQLYITFSFHYFCLYHKTDCACKKMCVCVCVRLYMCIWHLKIIRKATSMWLLLRYKKRISQECQSPMCSPPRTNIPHFSTKTPTFITYMKFHNLYEMLYSFSSSSIQAYNLYMHTYYIFSIFVFI